MDFFFLEGKDKWNSFVTKILERGNGALFILFKDK